MVSPAVPAWVYKGAKFDLDFANDRIWGGTIRSSNIIIGNQSKTLVSGPGTAVPRYGINLAGKLVLFGQYEARYVRDVGLFTDLDTTNVALWCRDFTNAVWTKTNMTATKNQIGAEDAANSASLLTATASDATALQSVTLTSRAFATSVWMKRSVGTGTVSITTDNVTWTDITSQINSTSYTRVVAPNQTLANPVFGIKISTSGDAVIADFFQTEHTNAGGTVYPTFPLLTTTASVARLVEEPYYGEIAGVPNAGQRMINDIMKTGGPWSCRFEYFTVRPISGALILSDGGVTLQADATGAMGFSGQGGTQAVSGSAQNIGLFNWNRVCAGVNGQGNKMCLNGGPVVTAGASFLTPATVFTHCGLASNGNGGGNLGGAVSRMTLWARELSEGEMIEYTRPS